MHLAADDAPAPRILLGGSGLRRIGGPAKAGAGIHLADGFALQPFERVQRLRAICQRTFPLVSVPRTQSRRATTRSNTLAAAQ